MAKRGKVVFNIMIYMMKVILEWWHCSWCGVNAPLQIITTNLPDGRKKGTGRPTPLAKGHPLSSPSPSSSRGLWCGKNVNETQVTGNLHRWKDLRRQSSNRSHPPSLLVSSLHTQQMPKEASANDHQAMHLSCTAEGNSWLMSLRSTIGVAWKCNVLMRTRAVLLS